MQKRQVVKHLQSSYKFSERSSCNLIGISRRTHRYQSAKDDNEVLSVLKKYAHKYVYYGFWKLYDLIRLDGYSWNHKRLYRLYVQAGLQFRKRKKRKKIIRDRQPMVCPVTIDQSWSMDFMHHRLYNQRSFRLLNIIDDCSRELVSITAGYSISSHRVVKILQQLKQEGRKPLQIRVDNGPEFIAKSLKYWCSENGVKLNYIQPGKPTQNGLIERLNKTCRLELLNQYLFKTMSEVEEKATKWWLEYNEIRPHQALNNISPNAFKKKKLLHL